MLQSDLCEQWCPTMWWASRAQPYLSAYCYAYATAHEWQAHLSLATSLSQVRLGPYKVSLPHHKIKKKTKQIMTRVRQPRGAV